MTSKRKTYPPDDPRVIACNKAKAKSGGATVLAKRLGMTSQGVANWFIVPADRVLAVERATGISRYELRPDVFGTIEQDVQLDDIAGAARLAARSIELAKALGISLETLGTWQPIPPERCRDVENLTGISRHVLRPDVFGTEPELIRRRRPQRRQENEAAQTAATEQHSSA
jgi:DNA-binding transcriptional regulator YdaS (Cro superfamily)